jgi:GNAT superfamily N-acetyltransferase
VDGEIKKINASQVDRVMEIIADGREYLKYQGLSQWQNGGDPKRDDVERDAAMGEGYALHAGGIFCGYAALCTGVDEYYTRITGGSWDERYAEYISIHRFALCAAFRGKGLSEPFLRGLLETARKLGYRDVRIDTHRGNKIMRKLIDRAGFVYRGTVVFPVPDGERMAFQKI